MQNPDGERVIKLARERQTIDVRLNDVRVWQRTRRSKRCLDRRAEIDADYVLRAPTRGELRVASLAATAFEHDLIAKKFRRDRRNPTEKLFGVARVFLREVLPLPTEPRGRRAFVALDRCEVSKPRHASRDRKRRSAVAATQSAFDYFLLLTLLYRELQVNVTGRTDKIRE